jgi:hypothetical protein
MRPRPQRHLVSEITSNMLKVKRYESERFYELNYMYSYVIDIAKILLKVALNTIKQTKLLKRTMSTKVDIYILLGFL